jgi:hypothetical protein
MAVAPRAGSADVSHYRLEPGVRLGDDMRPVIGRIADDFHRRTGRGIVITSGTRSSREQADAMFDKLRLGQRLTSLYLDFDAASEIQSAYRSHQRRGRGPSVTAMARVIDAQMRRGCFISRHLHASAADVRSRDMSRRQRRAFEQAVAGVPQVSLLAEGTPPHFHLQRD